MGLYLLEVELLLELLDLILLHHRDPRNLLRLLRIRGLFLLRFRLRLGQQRGGGVAHEDLKVALLHRHVRLREPSIGLLFLRPKIHRQAETQARTSSIRSGEKSAACLGEGAHRGGQLDGGGADGAHLQRAFLLPALHAPRAR